LGKGVSRGSLTSRTAFPDAVLLARVDSEMAHQHAKGTAPGLAYGVIANGRLVHTGGLGESVAGTGLLPDADTVFRIASMTKSFTGALILLLRDDGLLRLDDPVADHLPELARLPLPTTDSSPVTLRHLLTMTAGFPTDDPWGDRQQSLSRDGFDEILRQGLSFAWAPGSTFEYSNLGYALLGRVIESCTGTSYHEALRDRLLTPLGLTATVLNDEEIPTDRRARGHRSVGGTWVDVPADGNGAFAPMGGLFSSVRDLSAWVAGFTDAFPPRNAPPGPHPLSRASRREMQSPQRLIDTELDWPMLTTLPTARTVAYGFGLRHTQDTRYGVVIGHSGGYPGFGSHMRWHQHSGLGVIVLGNSTYAPAFVAAGRALSVLLDDLTERGHRPAPATHRPEALTAHRADQRRPPPSGIRAWPRTLQAKAQVDRLIQKWDDDLAVQVFADNVDLDEPWTSRRSRIERLHTELGPLSPDDDTPLQHLSPAHCRWWLVAPRGRVRVEILLSPQQPPLVQSLSLTPIPDPSPPVKSAITAVLAALNSQDPHWPSGLSTTVGLDRHGLTRQLRLAAALAGRCDLGEAIGGDGTSRSTVLLVGELTTLSLTVAVDSESGDVRGLVLRQEE
jgi:CubicO group peptidase (beta-lactamase class C family)